MREDDTLVVLRRCREVQLSDNAVSAALPMRIVNRADRLVPGGTGVPDMVRFIVQNQHAPVPRNPVAQLFAGIERLCFRDRLSGPGERLGSLAPALPRVKEAVDVGEVENAPRASARPWPRGRDAPRPLWRRPASPSPAGQCDPRFPPARAPARAVSALPLPLAARAPGRRAPSLVRRLPGHLPAGLEVLDETGRPAIQMADVSAAARRALVALHPDAVQLASISGGPSTMSPQS